MRQPLALIQVCCCCILFGLHVLLFCSMNWSLSETYSYVKSLFGLTLAKHPYLLNPPNWFFYINNGPHSRGECTAFLHVTYKSWNRAKCFSKQKSHLTRLYNPEQPHQSTSHKVASIPHICVLSNCALIRAEIIFQDNANMSNVVLTQQQAAPRFSRTDHHHHVITIMIMWIQRIMWITVCLQL